MVLDFRSYRKLIFIFLCSIFIIITKAMYAQNNPSIETNQSLVAQRNTLPNSGSVIGVPVQVAESPKQEHNEDIAIEWLMRERRQVVRQTCASLEKVTNEDKEMPHFIPINSTNALFLPIAKAGSTNWKKIIMLIEGDAPPNMTIPAQISGTQASICHSVQSQSFNC